MACEISTTTGDQHELRNIVKCLEAGYDAVDKKWTPARRVPDWTTLIDEWAELGASGIGGCCRVQPGDIAEMRSRLVPLGTGGGPGSP